MKIHLRDAFSSLFVFAFSLTAFIMAGDFGGTSGTFPQLISGLMMAASALMFLRSVVRPPALVDTAKEDEPSDSRRLSPTEVVRSTIAIGLTGVYILLLQPVGFFTASLIYIPASAYLLGLRTHATIWAGTLIYIGASFYLFHFIFQSPLPREAILRLF